MRRLTLLLFALMMVPLPLANAQEPYDNTQLGIAFEVPSGWEVREEPDVVIAASAEAFVALENGEVPQELVFRIIIGTFNDLNLNSAVDLPTQLARLVPSGVAAPEPVPVSYANGNGWEIEYAIPDSNITSRVGLLSLSNGRLALVRAFAASDSWEAAAAQFESILDTLAFSLPENLANPLASLPDNDGGVLWHYQGTPVTDGFPPVTLGGLTYDMFQLIYVAAGQRGVLVLDETSGEFINYLGPFFDDDNFVDIATGLDAKLYLANATPGDNNQIMIVNRAGQFENAFGSVGEAPGQFVQGMPRTLAVTRANEIWTISEGHSTEPVNRLYHFDRFGNLLDMIDIAAINPNLSNIHIDNNWQTSGLYLVGETGGLNFLDANGEALVTNIGTEVFELTTPVDIAIAPNDNIVISTDSQGFLEFAPSGAVVDQFGVTFDASNGERFDPGETRFPAGIVVGSTGVMHFAETNPDTGFSQVQAFRFTGDGNLALPFRPGSGQGEAVAPAIDPAAGGGDIAYGDVVHANINNQFPSHDWFFEGEAGDRLLITMRDISPEQTLDTRLVLIDPNLFEIAQNDDAGALAPEGFRETDSFIEFEIQAFGFYTIRATRFGGRGDYELTLERLSP
jgi:hypothetical protein